MASEDRVFTADEVAQHNKAKSLWLIINDNVYDVTAFHKDHPGGAAVMLGLGGKDATVAAAAAHKSDLPYTKMKEFFIGTMKNSVIESKSLGARMDASSGSFEEATQKSPNPAWYTSTDIDDSLLVEVVLGEEALVATADLVYQRLRKDKNLMRFMTDSNLRQLASQLRLLLTGVFEEEAWPTMQVSPDLIQGGVEGLADVLAEVLQEPLPLGEDPLVAAMHILNKERRGDPRVMNFFERVRSMVMDEDYSSQVSMVADLESLDAQPEEISMPAEVAEPAVVRESTLEEPMLLAAPVAPTPSKAAEAEAFNTSDAAGQINVNSFEELVIDPEIKFLTQDAWKKFLTQANSRQAAGEAIYTALFEGAPSLQNLFTTPRAVQAMRFMTGLNQIVNAMDNPAQLKVFVETLGFGHLHLEVTIPRVAIFRDAIIDLLVVELGEKFTPAAREGWNALMNYVGGAIIYVKSHYSERIATLLASWKSANTGNDKQRQMENDSNHSDDSYQSKQSKVQVVTTNVESNSPTKKGFIKWLTTPLWKKQQTQQHHNHNGVHDLRELGNGSATGNHNGNDRGNGEVMNANVPTTFPDMFRFNAAVMGFGTNAWMQEVLCCFDNIVTNVANSARLQEECEVLSLRIAKVATGTINLGEFKACMLASLRSLLPKDWSTAHEVAWTWLWKNVENMLEKNMYNPPSFERALSRLWQMMDQDQQYEMRKAIYASFFMAAPAGQDYFKQSNTRLHFIAQRILEMTLDLYVNPVKMVDDISALGLRHVGYGIPTELFGPFVTVCIEVLGGMNCDETALEAFRWSLGLISKILVRTINEGSTFVMMAVNANSSRQLKKAISSAPRGRRAQWLLHVQIGTQHISPLSWAIESGSLDVAKTILQDLRTIRADREAYYCGMDQLFMQHPDIIRRLCNDAPILLPTLLEGLVWRSRHTKHGLRRVNYYVKHLIVTEDGSISDAMKALVNAQDPKIISHPVIVLVSDSLWQGIVSRQFILRKIWFVMSLLLFMLSQAILPNLRIKDKGTQDIVNYLIFAGRLVSYTFGICRLSLQHGKTIWKEYREGDTVKVFCLTVPRYLSERYSQASFTLLCFLELMLTHEPMLWCLNSGAVFPSEQCERTSWVEGRYQVFSMIAMAVHWLLLVDLAVFSTGLSAFVLVCGHVLSEVSRFMVALSFLLLLFGSAISSLRHYHEQFRDVGNTVLTLFAITVGRYEGDYRELNDEPVLLGAVFLFCVSSAVLLLNLLIAQLNCSYEFVYQDMLGFARLNRVACIVETLELIPKDRWSRFISTLGLDQPLEFNEGDVGMAGGISTMEAASLHPTLEESIHRFGGSCSPEMQWPEDDKDEQEDQFERMERLIQKVMKRMSKQGAKQKGEGGAGSTDHGDDDDDEGDD